ncbi:immunity 49 family protein [Streptomyces sp. NPDC059447]|uniref:immunity 49 family protein n=1 Tax=Streptomyces sp. NPDC059447 TaxID=3346834 RepID=UPI0036CEB305
MVLRHPFPAENAEAGLALLEGRAETWIGRLEGRPTALGSALSSTLLVAQARCLMDPRAAIYPTWDAWVTAMQVGSAVFAAATTTETHVQCRIAHKDLTLEATGPQPYVTPAAWVTAFYLAVVCRERDRITALCRVPLSLLRENGGVTQEFEYAWIETLQTYWHVQPGLPEKLTQAIEQSHPDIATNAPRDLLQCVLYPPINLFHQFLRKDEDGFNGALAEALELHKAYWSTPERAGDIAGFLALGPLAIACLAYDAGLEIEVESDYLPLRLLDRSWLGEFDT